MIAISAKDELLDIYRNLLRIRVVEEQIAARYGEWKMRCPTHLCVGQEAVAVGVCTALRRTDRVFSNHRAHGHYIAQGGDMNLMLAEIYGKASGCAGGRGGSMHLIDVDAGFLGATPIVGGTVPLAVGAAWSARLLGTDAVAVSFIGDGCMEEGVVHESFNFAALHRLPVLFVCENNGYSVYTPLNERQPDRPLRKLAEAHAIPTTVVDGNDVLAVRDAASTMVAQLRQGNGPCFIECPTHRWREHCGPNYDDELGYRNEGELAAWQARDPLQAFRRLLDEQGVEADRVALVAQGVAAEVAAAFEFAESSVPPAVGTMPMHVLDERSDTGDGRA